MDRRRKNQGRSKGFIKCWNCGGYVGSDLLDEEHYDDQCPLCDAVGLLD